MLHKRLPLQVIGTLFLHQRMLYAFCLTPRAKWRRIKTRKSARGADESRLRSDVQSGTLEPDPGNAGVGINGITSFDEFRVALPATAGIFILKEVFFMSYNLRRLTESAILIAIATVLSQFQFAGPWVLGGSITICSMLPIVLIANRYGIGLG